MEEIQGLSRAFLEDEDRPEMLIRLAAEHTRLFVNAFPTLVAPPYESFYQEGRVMGKAALDCRSIYAEDGLTVQEGGDLPDHILTQLEYLLFLCLVEKKAAEEGDTEARRFLRERERCFLEKHILNWVPEFCGRIQSHSHEPYYRVMARFMKNFMVLEYKNLNHQVELDPFEEVFNEVKKV
jgi:TorA maturation chaperone TorD